MLTQPSQPYTTVMGGAGAPMTSHILQYGYQRARLYTNHSKHLLPRSVNFGSNESSYKQLYQSDADEKYTTTPCSINEPEPSANHAMHVEHPTQCKPTAT